MDSVSSVFAPRKSKRRADQPLFIGSVKSNIGHGEAVSGTCALLKTLMMFQKNIIPPHCGIKTRINENFPSDLEERQLRIASKATPFLKAGNSPRYVFINNFSAAGGNTAMLLEDAPVSSSLTSDPRSSHIVVVSAKSLSSFKQNLQRLLAWSKDQTDSVLPSLAYTTTARRSHYQYRVAIEAKDMVQLRQSLSSHTQGSRTPISSSAKPQVAFTFTGQGSHYIGLGQKLFRDVASFSQDISDFDALAASEGFPSFAGLIDGTIADLIDVSPVVTQLAITCSQIALARLWASWGFSPSVVVGHSLGEYAALQVAGVLSILDTILLVGRRAELLVSACAVGSHGMLAVRSTLSSIEPLISNIAVEIACINGPEELVLSGTVDQIDLLNQSLLSQGIKATKLNVPYAFHSAQVDPILDSFKSSTKSATFNTPHIPVISTLLGKVVTTSEVFGPDYLARHCRESVNFLGGLTAALDDDTVDEKTVWIELGPHPVCANMIKAIIGLDTIAVPSLRRNEDPWKTISSGLSSLYHTGVHIDWQEYHRDCKLLCGCGASFPLVWRFSKSSYCFRGSETHGYFDVPNFVHNADPLYLQSSVPTKSYRFHHMDMMTRFTGFNTKKIGV